MKIFITYISLLIFSFGVITSRANNNIITDTAIPKKISAVDKSTLIKLTKKILTYIKKKDYNTFAAFIHPVLGVRFSPYAFVDYGDVQLKPKIFIKKVNSKEKVYWGEYDGSGDYINLTVKEYFRRFVYDVDFIKEKIHVNEQTHVQWGNEWADFAAVYPDCNFTEMYYPGDMGSDWRILRLVFKKHKGNFYLIGVVHNQATI